jgi:tRNA 2-thiocytidine biosynthesis protein TtcA
MPYASPLEARLAKRVTKAITDYKLIADGDRVMVGLSGGKDSWALMQILDVLRKRAPIEFSLIGVTVDSGYDGFRHDLIASTC